MPPGNGVGVVLEDIAMLQLNTVIELTWLPASTLRLRPLYFENDFAGARIAGERKVSEIILFEEENDL